MIRKWNRACSRWRKICIRRLARKYQRVRKIRRFRTCLAVMLCVELLTGAGMFWNRNRPELNLMRREEFCEVELIPKTVADRQDVADAGKTGESGAAGKDEAAKNQDIYGIRMDWKALEVQFYHRKDVIQKP